MSYIHPSATVEEGARIGEGTRIWHGVQVRKGAQVGTECIIGKGVFIDQDVRLGNRIKIQNHVSVFKGVVLEDGVFIGPHVCFTNDLEPRAITPDGGLKSADDWELAETRVVVAPRSAPIQQSWQELPSESGP